MSTRKSPLAYVRHCPFCQALFSPLVAVVVGSDKERVVVWGAGAVFWWWDVVTTG